MTASDTSVNVSSISISPEETSEICGRVNAAAEIVLTLDPRSYFDCLDKVDKAELTFRYTFPCSRDDDDTLRPTERSVHDLLAGVLRAVENGQDHFEGHSDDPQETDKKTVACPIMLRYYKHRAGYAVIPPRAIRTLITAISVAPDVTDIAP